MSENNKKINTFKKSEKQSDCMAYFLLRCRMSVSSRDRRYSDAQLLAPYAAVHSPKEHVAFVHAVLLTLPLNC